MQPDKPTVQPDKPAVLPDKTTVPAPVNEQSIMTAQPLVTSRQQTYQRGFSLVELMIAMLIGLILVLACSGVYASLKGSINSATSLANAQESLRGAFNLLSRSVRQADSYHIRRDADAQRLEVTYDSIQSADRVIGCLGTPISQGSKETFYVSNAQLMCDDGMRKETIALDVEQMLLSRRGEKGVDIQLKIKGMPTNLGPNGLKFTLALRQKIVMEETSQ